MKTTDSTVDTATRADGRTPVIAREGPVVIVDDDPYDALLCEGVIDEVQPKYPAQILTSGEDLVEYLQGKGLYHDRSQYPLPGLVLLDLNMPKMNGFEVLDWLRGHPEFSDIPIVVLSGAVEMVADVTRAYSQGAHSFLPKPIQLRDLQSLVSILRLSI